MQWVKMMRMRKGVQLMTAACLNFHVLSGSPLDLLENF